MEPLQNQNTTRRYIWAATFVLAAVFASLLSTSSAQQTTPKPSIEQPKGLAPDLGRPTRPDDQVPLFDFDKYFLGKWSFEADSPDSPLGPGGVSRGEITYTKTDDGFYEAVTEGRGDTGRFTIREVIAYRSEAKTAFRSVIDSRGFSYVEMAEVGGNIGGGYSLFFKSAPFMFKGKKIRLTHTFVVVAPLVHRVDSEVSADNGPFLHMSPWRFSRVASPNR